MAYDGAGVRSSRVRDLALGAPGCKLPIAFPTIKAQAQAGDLFRVAFAAAIEQLVGFDTVLRVTIDDPELVHRARIAVRRLRSHLRTFRSILDTGWSRALDERLRWLGDGLGAARNVDVLLANVRHCAQMLPITDASQLVRVLTVIERDRAAAHGALGEMLSDPKCVSLLTALVEAAERPAFNQRASMPARDAVPELIGATWRKLRKTVHRLSNPPTDRELHRIRIMAKRARYAAEAAAPLVGCAGKAIGRYLESLQTVLGEQHDAIVAYARLREIGGNPEFAFVAGELAALENTIALDRRHLWAKAWRRVARRRTHFWRG